VDRLLHCRSVELAIGLCARPAHRRPLAAIEQAKLDSGSVGDAAHQAIERVDLTNQVAFAQTADRWIARHRASAREALRNERRARAQARGRGRRLTAGMAATNHNHIETTIHRFTKSEAVLVNASWSVKMVFHVKHHPN
jgi:hypothetical protein